MKNVGTLEKPNLKEEKNESGVSLSPLEKSLSSLGKITNLLSLLSSLILIGTFINLLLFIVIFFKVANLSSDGYSSNRYDREMFANFMMFFYGIVFVVVLASLYLYESKRKRGDVLFEEISDELEWYVDTTKEKIASVRPEINSRILLRSFIRTTDLPFVPGKLGPAFYLALNIFLLVFFAFYVSKLL